MIYRQQMIDTEQY